MHRIFSRKTGPLNFINAVPIPPVRPEQFVRDTPCLSDPVSPAYERSWTGTMMTEGRGRPLASIRPAVSTPPHPVRDRVVRHLVDRGLLPEDRLALGLERWERARRDGCELPLWRFLSTLPGTDPDTFFTTAAWIYGFRSVRFTVLSSLSLIAGMHDLLADATWDEMIERCVMPVVEQGRPAGEDRVIFATPDPTHPDTRRLLESLPVHVYELCHTLRADLYALIDLAFPLKKHLLPHFNR